MISSAAFSRCFRSRSSRNSGVSATRNGKGPMESSRILRYCAYISSVYTPLKRARTLASIEAMLVESRPKASVESTAQEIVPAVMRRRTLQGQIDQELGHALHGPA